MFDALFFPQIPQICGVLQVFLPPLCPPELTISNVHVERKLERDRFRRDRTISALC